MEIYIDFFNSREKAIIIWLFIFFVGCLFHKKIRVAIFNVLKAIVNKKILIVLIGMFLYVALVILLFYKIQIWTTSLAKDTLVWFITSAFILLMDSAKASQDERYFRKLFYDNLKLILLLEFIINLYTFSLWVEILLVPFIVVISAMGVVAGFKEEHLPIKKLTDFSLILLGSCIVVFSAYKIYGNYYNLVRADILRAFLLTPLLTFAYMPFLYLLALFMAYETLFVRLDWLLSHNRLVAKFAKRKILATCLVNLCKLNTFAKEDAMKFLKSTSKVDVLNIMEEFKNRQKEHL